MQLVWHSFWRSHTCISSLNQKWVKIFNALAWPHIIIKLKKPFYGLKQALRAWYSRIDSYLQRLGFSKREVDPNLYFKIVKNNHWYWFSMLMICSLLERTFDCLVQEGAHLWFRDERLRSYAHSVFPFPNFKTKKVVNNTQVFHLELRSELPLNQAIKCSSSVRNKSST